MTPRTALLVALIGLVLAALCAIPLYFIGSRDPANDDEVLGIILLDLGGLLGLTVLVVGLILAAATALRIKRPAIPNHSSRVPGNHVGNPLTSTPTP